MTNRIRNVCVVNHRLDPHETELRVFVDVKNLTPTTEIKGRLLGPRSSFASTVEVAYPLREVGRVDQVVLQAVIPESSWWEPRTPLLYQLRLELWQNSECCDRKTIHHGIRYLQITSTSLKLNGRPFILRGKVVESTASEDELRQIRDQGCNAVMTTFTDTLGCHSDLWQLADRCGLFVLYRAELDLDWTWIMNQLRGKNASAFGFVGKWDTSDENLIRRILQRRSEWSKALLGIESTQANVPRDAAFMLCQETELLSLDEIELPKIVLAPRLPDPLPTRPDVIGWIEFAS